MTRVLRPALPLLALLATPAFASDCEHRRDLSLAPDLAGVTRVEFDVGAQDLLLEGGDGAPTLSALACASDPAYLDQLVFEQRRDGDTLVITARREGYSSGVFFKPTYAGLRITARLPAGLDYRVHVGSGDAEVRGVARLDARVGSGDLSARDITGRFAARVGSGDIEARGVGSLDLDSVGSGDIEVYEVTGDARVGSIGSGDLTLDGVGGDVEIGSIGSGDADIGNVAGDVRVRRIGSGDLETRRVSGVVERPAD